MKSTLRHPGHAAAALFVALTLSSSVARADPPHEPPRSIYRFDVSITGFEEGSRPAPASYTITLQENQPGFVSTGANVPLVTSGAGVASAPRQDVGLSLRFTYALRGEVALLAGSVEMSSVAATMNGGAATIHRVRADGVAPVTPGTPALFSSVYDLATHRRYEVTVSARRIL